MTMMDTSNASEAVVDTKEKLPLDTDLPQDDFEPEAPLTALILPYAFAKRHGVLIGQIEDDEVTVLHRDSPDPVILAEVSRVTRRKISLNSITEEQFAALLAQTYEQASDQAMAMMEANFEINN